MGWNVEYTDEFGVWWEGLPETVQIDLDASVQLLEVFGPALSRPHCDTIQGSTISNLKELRTQSGGRAIRTFFVFDPRRTAILLIGGDKTGDDRFYERMIPKAETLYRGYLNELQEEGEL